MINFFKNSIAWAFAAVTVIFTFVPESFFGNHKWISQDILSKSKVFSCADAEAINTIISRFACFLLIWLATSLVYAAVLKFRRRVTIKGHNYSIQIEYGDILKKRGCKRVINFDECFTTQVGCRTADVNPTSICGQYLEAHPDLDIQPLIDNAGITAARGKSKYQQKTRYIPGTIVPSGYHIGAAQLVGCCPIPQAFLQNCHSRGMLCRAVFLRSR